MDDDRLERFGWSQDEPPRERQPPLPRGAPPARPLIPDRDRRRADRERRRVSGDSRSIAARARGLSHASRTAASGRRSAGATWTMISSSSAPPTRSTRRSPRAGPPRPPPEADGVAAETDDRPVSQAATRVEHRPVAGLPLEMSAQPRLALGEERGDVALRDRPSRAGRPPGWSPPHLGPGGSRPAARASAATAGACTGSRRRPASRRPLSRSRGRALDDQPGGPHVAAGPSRSPVSPPWRIAGRPLTTTCSMPRG